MGDFVFFSYFRGSGVLGLCSRPARSQVLQKHTAFDGHIARHCRKLEEGFRAQESRAQVYFH